MRQFTAYNLRLTTYPYGTFQAQSLVIPAPLPLSTCRSFLMQNVLYVSFCRIAVADVIEQLHLLGTDSSVGPIKPTAYNFLSWNFPG
jgi:hypothetical protein